MKANIPKQQDTTEQNETGIKNVMNLAEVLSKDGIGSFEDIAAIMALDDKEFEIMSELVLSATEKELSNSNNKILLKKEMETYGLSQEELLNEYGNLMMALDTLKGELKEDRVDFLKRYIGIMTNAFTEDMPVGKKIIEIPIELEEGLEIPKYTHIGDAGIDIRALEDYEILPGETKLVKTGIKIAIPQGYEIQVRPRSGLSLKTKMRVANSPGTIDSNYRGEVGIIIDNIEPPIKDITYEPVLNEDGTIKELNVTSILHGAPCHIQKGDRIAQLVLAEVPLAHFYQVENIGVFDSERGEDGFGSSGKE